jgi:cytochrome c
MNMNMNGRTPHTLTRTLALVAALTATSAFAAPDQSELARESGCFSCHSPTEKIVGPAFQSVAERYAGQKDAASELAQSVTNGSTKKWGRAAAMPPHPNMSQADIRRLVEWVLSLKK